MLARGSSAVVVPSRFENRAIRLMAVAMPAENVLSCCWMYSKNAWEFGAHRPIFFISVSPYPASLRAHAPPDLRECVSVLEIGMPRAG